MTDKKSLLLHYDTLSVIDELNDEQAGKLIKEIYAYSMHINNPEKAKKPTGLSGLLNCVFHPFKKQIERDFEAYEKKVAANRENGKKGGRPKNQTPEKKPKKADKDKDKDKDKDLLKEKLKEKEKYEKAFESFWKKYIPVKTREGTFTSKGDKKPAKEKYLAILAKSKDPEREIQEIEAGLELYLRTCSKNNTLTKHAQRFLQQESWKREDEDQQPTILTESYGNDKKSDYYEEEARISAECHRIMQEIDERDAANRSRLAV